MDFKLGNIKITPIKVPKFKVSSTSRMLPRKRDYAKMTNFLNKSIREPVPAKIKKEALKRANHKCQWRKCNEKEILDIHHKDMNPENNRLSNLMVICPTHHRKYHQKYKRVDTHDITGRRISSKVYKKEEAKQIKKERKNNPLGLSIPKFDAPKFEY